MRRTVSFAACIVLALFAAPTQAVHPNFIDFVLVTDVGAQEHPEWADPMNPPEDLVAGWVQGRGGIYPPQWGGEGVGELGSQTAYHYVKRPNERASRGHWTNYTLPSDSVPCILEFDLRQIYPVNQICIWNLGTNQADTWFMMGARHVTVHYKKAPWDEWTEYETYEFAPAGWLDGEYPRNLYIGHNGNASGTYRVSNIIRSDAEMNLETPITSGAFFDTYFYPAGGEMTAGNLQPIEVDFDARFVRFEIKSNWGEADRVGLAEVRFYKDGPGLYIDVDPNPQYAASYIDPENNLVFGDAYRGWTKPQDIIVYNLGTTPAEVTGATVEGPFGLATDMLPVQLAAADGAVYDDTTLQAIFAPTSIGDNFGKIDVEYTTAAGSFVETLSVSGTGKDVAFGYIPYVQADASQWRNPWWGGFEPKWAVNGQRTAYNGGGPHMIEDMGEFVFGSKNALEMADNTETWHTGGYPEYPENPEVEEVVFAVDLGGALTPDSTIGRSVTQPSAVQAHDVKEIRIWNYTDLATNELGQPECMAAIRSVRFEYSTDMEAEDWEDVTEWTQWGDDIFQLQQPEPGVDIPATDVLDVTDIGEPIRWWRFTTLGLAAGAPGPNYGHSTAVGLGQIRFYTSKANVAIQPVGHDFGNLAPYESVDAPEITMQNVGTEAVIIESIEWDGDPGPFSITSAPTVPADLASGEELTGLVVNFTPKLYGTYQATLGALVIDNSDPGAEEKPENYVTLVFTGSCLSMENGFIPVDHAWASTSWDGNWVPKWTHAPDGMGIQEVPEGVWGSRDMQHESRSQNRYMWHARQPGYPEPSSAWIAWDFGESKTLYDMLVWNSMRTGANGSGRGMRRVLVQYTSDAPPDVEADSEWGPWGGDNTIPIDYEVAWAGLNWLPLGDAVTLAHAPLNRNEPGNYDFNTPNGWYEATNQLNGNPIEFRGTQARMVRLVADSAPWMDWYLNGEAEGWNSTPNGNHFCLAEARFYGPTSAAVYDVTEHDFGSIEVGGSASIDITVTNLESATDDLTIQGVFVEDRSGEDTPSPYTLLPPDGETFPFTIPKGQNAFFTLAFAPTDAGDYNTFESVILNDSSRNGLMLTSLMGTAYEAGNPDVMLPATSVDFGERFLQLGTQGVPFTVKNMGDTALTVDFAFDPSDVFGTTQEGTLTVDPFSEAEVWVTVTPQSLGVTDGVMTLTTNDGDEGRIEVPLTVEVSNAEDASVEGSWMLYD